VSTQKICGELRQSQRQTINIIKAHEKGVRNKGMESQVVFYFTDYYAIVVQEAETKGFRHSASSSNSACEALSGSDASPNPIQFSFQKKVPTKMV